MERTNTALLRPGDRVALVRCSDPIHRSEEGRIAALCGTLRGLSLQPVLSDCLYAGGAAARARCLLDCYRDESIRAIFDLSGGDMANETLHELDFAEIAAHDKPFWGYSDLTALLNAIYAKTGRASVLYQLCCLTGKTVQDEPDEAAAALSRERMAALFAGDEQPLFGLHYRFVRGEWLEGVVVGGNSRCLLKLAGTPYWPDMRDKILLLEAYSGGLPRIVTYFSQLRDIGVFDQIAGVLLGRFTQMDAARIQPDVEQLACTFVPEGLPIVRAEEIGHQPDAKAIWIGKRMVFSRIKA